MPIPVTVRYTDGTSQEVIVPVRGRTTEHSIPLKGDVKNVEINARGTAIVEVYRGSRDPLASGLRPRV
jgi:hypothetical protein